jgi:glucosyl-dolichyl phosphate glucuronosyltransferase
MAGGQASGGLCVGIATRNRRAEVLNAVDSVAPQLGEGDELIVVDNDSGDGTREAVAARLEGSPFAARVLLEREIGCSAARNRVLRETASPVVAFLDDDGLAAPGWADALRRAWAEVGETTAVIGGPIAPEWGAPRPPWLRDYLLFVLGILDLGEQRRVLDQSPVEGYVWGGNMSVRVDLAVDAGGFDQGLGARPEARFARGEEQDLQRRLADRGYDVVYEPGALAYHCIPAERLSEKHFRVQLQAHASSDAAAHGRRIEALHRLARGSARYALAAVAGDAAARTVARLSLSYGWALLTVEPDHGIR